MNAILAYAGSTLAAWAAMGGFCLRSDAIRSRYRWGKFPEQQKRRYAIAAGVLCVASLWLALSVNIPSFALIFWIVELGILGIALSLTLPYRTELVVRSFRPAGVLALVSLLIVLAT